MFAELPWAYNMKVERRVVCAANRLKENGLIVCAPRHGDIIMRTAMKALGYHKLDGDWEQGFVDQWGTWMSREEALEVAWDAGQRICRCGGDDIRLYSENLY